MIPIELLPPATVAISLLIGIALARVLPGQYEGSTIARSRQAVRFLLSVGIILLTGLSVITLAVAHAPGTAGYGLILPALPYVLLAIFMAVIKYHIPRS